ncbi:MAG: DNA-3-methyladenine glycosylase family protein [Elainellaceae cyanobacterium]
MPSSEFVAPSPELRQGVEYVCQCDRAFLQVEAEAGTLEVRRWPPGFASLVRTIIGQQLSAKAARAIFLRLNQLMELTPAQMAKATETDLKQVGLSRAKIATCQQLAEAILSERLRLEALPSLPNASVMAELTQIKGIGPWTAEIYLLFCLERLDSFPAADLAIQAGYQMLKGLDNRPTRREMTLLVEPLEPYRGVVAHLLWHYYRFRAQ